MRDYKNTKPMKLPAKYKAGFLREFDKRSAVFALLNNSYQEVMDDMGGQDSLSHVQVCMAEKFVFLEFVLQNIEKRIAEKPKKSSVLIGKWIQGLNSLQGLGKTIGLKRQSKKIESLQSYVKGKSSKE